MEDHSAAGHRVLWSGLKLFSGTGAAQIVMMLTIPILSRWNSTSSFGSFGMFMASTTLLAVLVSGRYEMAIPLPEKEGDGWAIFLATLILGATASVLGFGALAILPKGLFRSMDPVVTALPLATFAVMGITSSEYWLNRKSCFSSVSLARVTGASAMAITQLGLSFLHWEAVGLVAGFVVGIVINCGMNFWKCWKTRPPSHPGPLHAIRSHARFPKFMLVAQVCNSAANHLPTLFFGTFFGTAYAGAYTMANRAMTMIDLLASAIGQAFYPEIAKNFALGKDCYPLLKNMLQKLGIFAVAIFPLLFVLSPWLFEFLLGKEWRFSGEIVRWVMLMFLLRFITYPATLLPMIAGRQDLYLVRQVLLIVCVLASLAIGWKTGSFLGTLFGYSMVYAVFYLLDTYLAVKLVKEGKYRRLA